MKRTNIYLADRQAEALRAESRRTGLTVAELVRRAVDRMLSRKPREPKTDGSRQEDVRRHAAGA